MIRDNRRRKYYAKAVKLIDMNLGMLIIGIFLVDAAGRGP